jgi:DNA-binding transcriptional ArsR family regulator
MSDIFKAIADPKARLVLEKLAQKPGSTATEAAAAAKVTPEQITAILGTVTVAGLVKATGTGASKKYSLNAKGFGPYAAWLAKVAETSAVANLELQVQKLGGKLGKVVADGSDWVSKKVKENVDVDAKKLAKDLGRSIAEVKKEVQDDAIVVKREAKKIVSSVKKDAKKIVTEVKKRVKR